MGAYSELDIERNSFYSPEEAPAGFALEDEPAPFEAQTSPQQVNIAEQPAADTASGADGEGDTSATEDMPDKAAVEAEDEDTKRKAHEDAEAKRKAEFDAKQAAKKAAEREQLAKVAAMSDDEVLAASMQRVSEDTEKLTRRNMKECVAEHIQTRCLEDPAFARLTMHLAKSMIHCFWYINRKAREFVEQEMKDNDIKPENGVYGSDVPDDLCYQWAEDYFRDPDAEEDHKDEEKFVPKPYIGGTSKSKSKAKKKKTEKKPPETSKPDTDSKPKGDEDQMSLLDVA